MIKKLILSSTYLITAILLLLFFGLAAAPALSYEEGWQTFYYDSDFLSVTMSSNGLGYCIKAFFLQFFANQWHGAIVLTVLCLFVMLLCNVCFTRFCKRRIIGYIGTPILTLIFAFIFTWWLSGASVLAILGIGSESQKSNITYMQLSDMSRKGDWDGIISRCDNKQVANMLFQNILNMALAEKGELGDKLLDQPVSDIRSIYINEIQEPELAGMLSDVFFSMGHIAQSQMYAFEANEKKDNLSPRMLQRLVITNILYGENNIARKYLYVLSKTLYYKEWTEQYTAVIDGKGDAKLTRFISEKRRCIFPDNRFSGIKGIDDDLLNVARCTRGTQQCKTTLQYLASLYILARYQEEFISMVKEFGGSKDLPMPLPLYFDKYYAHITQNNTQK